MRLRQRAEPVDSSLFDSLQLHDWVDSIVSTMRHANGSGLAATQVGLMQRICAMEVTSNPRYPYKPPIPLTVMVNPVWTPLDNETFSNYEGCLSVPGIRGRVTRHRRLQLVYHSVTGEEIREVHTGLRAGTIQHELDHLDGILFLDRVQDPHTLTTWDNFEAFHKEKWLEEIQDVLEEEKSGSKAATK